MMRVGVCEFLTLCSTTNRIENAQWTVPCAEIETLEEEILQLDARLLELTKAR